MPDLALPVDVVRQVEPEIDQSDIRGSSGPEDRVVGPNDLSIFRSYIRSAEDMIEDQTQVWRETVRGREADPRTWPTPDVRQVEEGRFSYLWIDLPDEDVHQILDVEVRDGQEQDDFEVVEPDDYTVDHRDGRVKITRSLFFRLYGKLSDFPGQNVRIRYKAGALGGDKSHPGQTEISSDVTDGDQSISVDDPERLPKTERLFLLEDEYIQGRIEGGSLSVTQRGAQTTIAESHPGGAVLHYCPPKIRKAVALDAAISVLAQTNVLDNLVEEYISYEEKRSTLQNQLDDILRTETGWEVI